MEQTAHWFWRRGYQVLRFEYDEIAKGRLDDDLLNDPEETVLRGGVEAVLLALSRAKRPSPPILDLPDSLSHWFGRRIWQTTMGQIRSDVEQSHFEPCHIKPLNQHKLFTGTVVREFRDLIKTASVPDQVPILAQEYVDFVAEWRAYVLRDEILHLGRYRGDPLLFPNRNAIEAALTTFENRPIAFGMDWGVTSSGETLLVEVNDGYSLGNYGLGGSDYSAMIEARWRELMGLTDNGVGRRLNEHP